MKSTSDGAETATELNLETKFKITRYLTVMFYALLILLFLVSQLSHEGGPNWVVFAIQAIPLLAFIPGLISQYYRVYSWLCFIILLYFVVAVMESLASTANIGDYIFLFLTVTLFIASMFCSRYAQRVQKNFSVKS